MLRFVGGSLVFVLRCVVLLGLLRVCLAFVWWRVFIVCVVFVLVLCCYLSCFLLFGCVVCVVLPLSVSFAAVPLFRLRNWFRIPWAHHFAIVAFVGVCWVFGLGLFGRVVGFRFVFSWCLLCVCLGVRV